MTRRRERPSTRIFTATTIGDRAEIWLYGPIGSDYYEGVSAKEFGEKLSSLRGASTIDIRINSPGGDVFAGAAIYALLVAHPATINVFIDGQAASIATLIAMAGDTITIAANGEFMIHDPWVAMAGNARELTKMVERLGVARQNIIATYAARTGLSESTLAEYMSAFPDGTEFSAEEALAAGFVDAIAPRQAIAALALPAVANWRKKADPEFDDGFEIMEAIGEQPPKHRPPAGDTYLEDLRDKIAEMRRADDDAAFKNKLRGRIAELKAASQQSVAAVDDDDDLSPWEMYQRGRERVEALRETCSHEAKHATVGLAYGAVIREVRADANCGHCLFNEIPQERDVEISVAGTLWHEGGIWAEKGWSDKEFVDQAVQRENPDALPTTGAWHARVEAAESRCDEILAREFQFYAALRGHLEEQGHMTGTAVHALWEQLKYRDQ